MGKVNNKGGKKGFFLEDSRGYPNHVKNLKTYTQNKNNIKEWNDSLSKRERERLTCLSRCDESYMNYIYKSSYHVRNK